MNQKEPEWKPPSWYLKIAVWSSIFFSLLGLSLNKINDTMAYDYRNLNLDGVVFPLPHCVSEEKPVEPPRRVGQVRPSPKANPQREVPEGSVDLEALIQKYSEQYQVRATLVKCIIYYESTNNPNAVGSAGEQGLCQFKIGTWKSFRRQMGEDEAVSPFNPEAAIKTLAWALSKGYARHWSVYKSGKCH